MTKRNFCMSVALAASLVLLIASLPSSAAPADDVVSAALQKWSDAFAKKDWNAMSSLYSKDTLFYGSTPPLYRGLDGVKAYFAALPPMVGATVAFKDLVVVPIGSDLINIAGIVTFAVPGAPAAFVFRITQSYVNEDGAWKIVSHHVSHVDPH
ncbi:AtzH-like domain-containing protein [Bradyrhizobium genosp. P]|uniref:AtzH-like domain-containing protein n=1 Tax=Bradyrhizobium genosp. P TaxID=83641 RepID=UPI003CF51A6A